MNIWGVILVLPMALMVIFNPLEAIPAMIFMVVWVVVWLAVLNWLIGSKPPRE